MYRKSIWHIRTRTENEVNGKIRWAKLPFNGPTSDVPDSSVRYEANIGRACLQIVNACFVAGALRRGVTVTISRVRKAGINEARMRLDKKNCDLAGILRQEKVP